MSKVKNDRAVFHKWSLFGETALNKNLHQCFASPCQFLSGMLCVCLRELFLRLSFVVLRQTVIFLNDACFPVVGFFLS